MCQLPGIKTKDFEKSFPPSFFGDFDSFNVTKKYFSLINPTHFHLVKDYSTLYLISRKVFLVKLKVKAKKPEQ